MNNNLSGSVLATLRALVPKRRLTYSEALRLAELQANRLIELFDITSPQVPNELITELPRMEVRLAPDLPVSGATHWESGRWLISLNATEPYVRRRFSLMHEFKHVLDHTTKHFLYGDVANDRDAANRAERAADQFAACLLMPKRWIKREWFDAGQRVSVAASRFGVSSQALTVRLWLLGMAPETQRCFPSSAVEVRSDPTPYLRRSPLLEKVA